MRADLIKVTKLGILLLFYSLFASTTLAQNVQFTQGSVGAGLDNTLQIPLKVYPGRAGASIPISLSYSSRVWRVNYLKSVNENINGFNVRRAVTEASYAEYSAAGWTSSLGVPIVEWPKVDDLYWYDGKPYHIYIYPYTFRVARVYIHMPDGSSHEFRKSDQPYSNGNIIDMVGTFYAVDGSRMRYESSGQSTGTLYLSDGARYILDVNTVQYIDRNGNTLNYDRASRQWTDTLGRVIGDPLPVNPQPTDYPYSPPGVTTPYIFRWRNLSSVLLPNEQGQTPSLKNLSTHILPDPYQPPTNQNEGNFPQALSGESLFSSVQPDEDNARTYTYVVGKYATFDPVVLAEVVLPNGLSYKFSYNIYGEISKVTYPTGAFELYEMSPITPLGGSGSPYDQASRGVTSRKLNSTGIGTNYATWTYSTTGTIVTTKSPDRMETEVYRHFASGPFGFDDARNGLAYDERIYAPGQNGQRGPLLRRKLTEWQMTSNNVPARPGISDSNNKPVSAYRNARPSKEVSIILDTNGNALAKTTTYGYDLTRQMTTGLDQTSSKEFYYTEVDQNTAQTGGLSTTQTGVITIPAGAEARSSATTYLNDQAYLNRNILGFPTSSATKDASGNTVAKTEMFYDEFGSYPLMPYGAVTGWTDPGQGTKRGLLTTTRRYVDVGANIYLDTHTQYDQCGSVRETRDARNNVAQTSYEDSFEGPNQPSGSTYAYPTSTSSAVPDPSGTNGSAAALVSSTKYDFQTGLTTSSKDANSQTTEYSYKDEQNNPDPLNRLRKVTRPDGSWTKYIYNDTDEDNDQKIDFYLLTQTQQDNSNPPRILETYQYFDAMGRASRSFLKESSGSYLATDTEYDSMGRVWRTSNPYHTTQRGSTGSQATHWVTTTYDALGRSKQVTLADGTSVQTNYEGVYTTVTDQAGKKRRQKTDALGRIVRVDEPDTTGSLGASVDTPAQATYYEYDVLGNVVHVQQGANPYVQHRYFKYDSLSRLTYERQVEQATIFSASDPLTSNTQWSRKLIYDETINNISYAGLLTSQYDARNIRTQYTYDYLNRVRQIAYSRCDVNPCVDESTPKIDYFYDTIPFTVDGDSRAIKNLGRLSEVRTEAKNGLPSTSQAYNYDLVGRIIHTRQTVGTINPYTTTYEYNLGGALKNEKYPSGRVITYDYDDAARLSGVASGGTTYASQFKYDEQRGLLSSFVLGNPANLVKQNFTYNSRLQVQSIELAKGNAVLQRYEYKYGQFDEAGALDETKNNGQIAQIEGFIETAKQWQQQFEYDSLGRLKKATEYPGTGTQFTYQMNYEYDLFGNRYQKEASNQNSLPYVKVEDSDINKLTNRFTVGITDSDYDAAGNILRDPKFTLRQYTYDANNRQRQGANLDGSGAVVSVYDGTGQRVATMTGGVVDNVLVYDAGGKLVAEYGQTPVNSGTSYVFADHQSSTRVALDSNGNVTSRHDYQPFGAEVSAGVGARVNDPFYGQSDSVRQKYAGMEADDGSTNSHTLWRKYDPKSGRWTAPDPYSGSMTVGDPQSFNRYTYVNNDPINQTDSTGLMPNTGADVGWAGFEGFGGGFDFTARASAGQETVRAREAERDRAIADTMEANFINEGLKDGSITRDQAEEMVRNNPNLEIEKESHESAHADRAQYGKIVGSINRVITTRWAIYKRNGVEVRRELLGVSSDITTTTIEYSTTQAAPLPPGVMPRLGLFHGDVRGHIVGRALGGPPTPMNLFSQDKLINNSQYKSFEYSIRKQLSTNKNWVADLRIALLYNPPAPPGGSQPGSRTYFRPIGVLYTVTYREGNRVVGSSVMTFRN